jgi:hypothetical protein
MEYLGDAAVELAMDYVSRRLQLRPSVDVNKRAVQPGAPTRAAEAEAEAEGARRVGGTRGCRWTPRSSTSTSQRATSWTHNQRTKVHLYLGQHGRSNITVYLLRVRLFGSLAPLERFPLAATSSRQVRFCRYRFCTNGELKYRGAVELGYRSTYKRTLFVN